MDSSIGYGKCAAHDIETCDPRCYLSGAFPAVARDTVSLREFDLK